SLAIVHSRVDGRRRWSAWLAGEVPEADVVAAVPSWLDLLADPSFPPDAVLFAPADDQFPLPAKIAALRSGGSSVVVVAPQPAWSFGPAARAAGAHAIVTPATRPGRLRGILRGRVPAAGAPREPLPLRVVPASAPAVVARPRLSEQERRALVLYVSGDK